MGTLVIALLIAWSAFATGIGPRELVLAIAGPTAVMGLFVWTRFFDGTQRVAYWRVFCSTLAFVPLLVTWAAPGPEEFISIGFMPGILLQYVLTGNFHPWPQEDNERTPTP